MTINTKTADSLSGEERDLLSQVTAEHLLYGAFILIGALLRFMDLGHVPLSSEEAVEAVSVWNVWQAGANGTGIIGSPAYHNLTALVSYLLGFSDALMRVVPALVGIATIMLPWWLKSFVGQIGGLIAALLIAVSPLFVITSRTAGGTSIAIFAALLMLTGWLHFQDKGGRRSLYVLAIGIAVGLTSSPLFFGLAAAIITAWLGQHTIGPALFTDSLGNRRRIRIPDRALLIRSLAIGIITFAALGTGLLLNLGGIGAAGQGLADWISAFSIPSNSQIWISPLSSILRYDLLIVILGLAAIVWATWRIRPFPMFLVYWAVAGLALILLQQGLITNALLVTLPGIFLVASFAQNVLETRAGHMLWVVLSLIVISGMVVYVNLGRYSMLMPSELQDNIRAASYHLFLVILTLIVVTLLLMLIWGLDRKAVVQGTMIGLLALLTLRSMHTANWLAMTAANDPREPWVLQATDDDIRLLKETVQETSWKVSGSDVDLAIISSINYPALNWYFREMNDYQVGEAIPASVNSPALFTDTEDEPQLSANYIGIDFGYRRSETSIGMSFWQALRWWMFQESTVPIDEEQLIFWLRSDLAGVNQ